MALSYSESNIDSKLTKTYASISAADNSTAQSIATGITYTKVINFDTDGVDNNCTSDFANNKITITDSGKYIVNGSFSMSSGTNNVELFGSLFVDGAEIDEIHFQRKISTLGDVGSASFSGLIDVSSIPVDIDFRVRHDNAGSINFTFSYMNLSVYRIDV